MTLKNKYEYTIEHDRYNGNWIVGYYYWRVTRADDRYRFGDRVGGGWCYTKRSAWRGIRRAVRKYEKLGETTVERGEL